MRRAPFVILSAPKHLVRQTPGFFAIGPDDMHVEKRFQTTFVDGEDKWQRKQC